MSQEKNIAVTLQRVLLWDGQGAGRAHPEAKHVPEREHADGPLVVVGNVDAMQLC